MKIKRIALSLISCFALLVSSIPSTAVFVSAETSGNGKAADPYTASNYDELTEALGKSGVDEDGVSYIKLTSGFSTDEFITVDFPKKVVIDGGSNAITGGGFNLKGNVTLKNLTFTTDNKKNAVIIGDAINANTVTLEGVTITQTAPSESKDIVTTIWINSKTNVTPNVTLKDCNITVNSNANVKDRARAIVLSDEGTAGTGSGTLTLDNTTVKANEDQGGNAVGIDILAKGAAVKIQNGSKIVVPKRYGISVFSQEANITIDNSEVESWGAIYFMDGNNNYKSTGNTVTIKNKSKITSTNPFSEGVNNFAAICFSGKNDSVTLDETSSIVCKGSGEEGKAQYVASFYSTDNNKLTIDGTISVENNPSDLDLYFTYSQSGDIDNAPETPAVVIGEKATVPGFTLNDSEGNFKQTYDKLSEAVANAEENDIIVMGENSKEPEVKADKKLTIQRKGHTANVTSEKYDVIVSEESYVVDHKLVEKKAKKCDGTSEYTYYVCELCGKYFEDNKGQTPIEDIQAKVKEVGEHSNLIPTSPAAKPANCMETGLTQGYKCEKCGQTVIEPQVLNRNDDHSWPETWEGTLNDDDEAKGYTAVTDCTKGGWQVEECARGCGARHYNYVEPKAAHNFGDPEIKNEGDKEATCTEPGQKTKTCKDCPYEEKVVIPALNHTNGKGASTIVAVPKVEASCKGEGTEGHDRYWYCTQCKREEGTYESKHDNDEYKWFSDAACTQEIVDHDSIFTTEEHDFSIPIEPKAPTCQESGHFGYNQCSKCGDIEDGKQVSDFYAPANPFGHVYSSGLQGEATESTCITKGKYQYFTCDLCNKTYIVKSDAKDEWENYTDIEEIHPANGTPTDEELALKPLAKHTWGTPVEYDAPDCETAGHFGSVQCTVCQAKFKTTDDKGVAIENEDEYVKVTEDTELEIAALGHEWVDDAAHHFNDNCTTYEYYMCNREDCGKLAMVVTDQEDDTILDSVKVKYIDSVEEAKKPDATHNWVDQVTEAKEPNCTENGTYAYAKCDKCGAFAEKLAAGGYKEWTAAADDKDGDGVITEADFVKKATGHNFEDGFVKGYASPDPCTQPGLKSYAVCQNDGCGVYALATLKAEASEGSDNPADYDYTPWTVENNDKVDPATGAGDGVIDENDFVIDIVGHVYGEIHPAYTPEGAAACTENGKKAYYECSVCSKLFIDAADGTKQEVTENELIIPAPGHKEEAIPASEDVAATCTGEGLTGGTRCSVCKTILTPRKVIPALGHDFKEENYKTKTPATCETNEIQEAKCSRCDATQTREKQESALGHAYEKVEAKEATCTEPGNIEHYKCSRCSKLFVDEEGVKNEVTADKVVTTKDHEYGELIAEVPATCTKEGTKAHYQCSECEKLFVDETTAQDDGTSVTIKKEVTAAELVIEKTAHTPKAVEAVEATCTKTGLTEGSVCDVCGEVLVAQTVTPMIDHTPVTDASSDATCTKSGLTEGKHCSVCGGTLVAQAVIPALGHNFVNGVCTRCNEKEPNYGDNTSVNNDISKPSSNSNNNNVTTIANKMPPKVLKVTQAKVTKLKVKSKAKKTINVSWKKVSGAKGYEVEVSKNSSFKKKARVVLKKTSKLKLTLKNKKIKSKKTYYVRVRAYTTYNSNGTTVKAYSNWNYVLRKVKVK